MLLFSIAPVCMSLYKEVMRAGCTFAAPDYSKSPSSLISKRMGKYSNKRWSISIAMFQENEEGLLPVENQPTCGTFIFHRSNRDLSVMHGHDLARQAQADT